MATHNADAAGGIDAALDTAIEPTRWSALMRRLGRSFEGVFECALAGESVTLCSAEMIEAATAHREQQAAAKRAQP